MAMFVTDAITAVFLFAEFSIVRTRALLVISSGYLFNAIIVIPWILTFPDVFVPGNLIGGLQSTPYIHFFWHAGFPTSVIAYALIKDATPEKRYWHGSVIGAVSFSIALTSHRSLCSSVDFYNWRSDIASPAARSPPSQFAMALFGGAHRVAERHRTYRTMGQATFNARFLVDRCNVRVRNRNCA